MPLPVIPGVVRCSISGSLPSLQRWTNVIHCRYSGGASSPGPSDITALDTLLMRLYSGTAFATGTPWFTNCAAGVTLDKASYTILDGSALGQDLGKALTGSGGSSALPAECAPVLTLRSTQRGRSHRGRVYLPVPSTTSIDTNGRLTLSKVSTFLVQVTGLMAALGGASVAPFWEIGIASYKLSVFTPLATPTMDTDIDVQRRRKR